MVITGTTQLLGVIGYPIKHSLSPVMHNAAIEHLGVDYAYVPLAIEPQHLSTAINGLWASGWQGFNVTIPHKQTIMAQLTDISPLAQAVGAVNTIWRTTTGWAGDNTDVAGFIAPLQSIPKNWPDKMAIVLGGGGAARAVVAGLQQLGLTEIWVVGRDLDKLAGFQASWKNSPLTVDVRVCGWEQLEQLLPQASLVVNCTPIGMAPQQNDSPLSAAQITKLPLSAIVYDLIYTPRPTELLQMSSAHSCEAINGLEMLIYQGAAALGIWLGQEAPVQIMRQALIHHARL